MSWEIEVQGTGDRIEFSPELTRILNEEQIPSLQHHELGPNRHLQRVQGMADVVHSPQLANVGIRFWKMGQ